MKYLAGILLFSLLAQKATAGVYTQGYGIALREGEYSAFTAKGIALSTRSDMVEFEIGALTGQMSWDSPSYTSGALNTTSYKQDVGYGMFKLHPMNGSFFFGFTVAQTKNGSEFKTSDASHFDEKMSIDRTLGTISVGNIWTPGGVILGCEWFGKSSALAMKERSKINGPTPQDEALKDNLSSFESNSRSLAGRDAYNLLVVYLGYMFGS